jgi:hypothetical protein
MSESAVQTTRATYDEMRRGLPGTILAATRT